MFKSSVPFNNSAVFLVTLIFILFVAEFIINIVVLIYKTILKLLIEMILAAEGEFRLWKLFGTLKLIVGSDEVFESR